MTKFTTILLLSAAVLVAQDSKDAKKAPVQAVEVTIPAGAKETDDGSFRYTDAKGKKWLYRKTPFGVSKTEDKAPVPQPQLPDTLTKATIDGEMVHFEKPTPFGVTKWDKKWTDLDPDEQKIVDRLKNKK